jgi:hypothetical protein
MTSKNWKVALLSSGLPLEYLVAKKLSEGSFHIKGEYSYIRQNEQDVNTEFSVDLLATKPLIYEPKYEHWGNINVIIECKYRQPQKMWVFSPHPAMLSTLPISENPIIVNQYLCTRRIDPEHLSCFRKDVQYCIKGTELLENKRDNPNDISHGLSQLRYAAPRLVLDGLSSQIKANDDTSLYIETVCPILVTTAPLYVLKSELNLEDFRGASEPTDVAEEVDVLIVSQASGPQLHEYCSNLFAAFLATNKVTEGYMEELGKILVKKDGCQDNAIPGLNDLLLTMLSSSEAILVVNYDALDNQIAKLCDAIIYCANRSLSRYTTLREDREIAAAGTSYYLHFADQAKPDR